MIKPSFGGCWDESLVRVVDNSLVVSEDLLVSCFQNLFGFGFAFEENFFFVHYKDFLVVVSRFLRIKKGVVRVWLFEALIPCGLVVRVNKKILKVRCL